MVKKLAATTLKLFRAELKNNLYLEESEKKYWLLNADKMPVKMIEYFLALLQKENNKAYKHIKKAIDKKPKLVAQIQAKAKLLKAKLNDIRGMEDEADAEVRLEKKLKQI